MEPNALEYTNITVSRIHWTFRTHSSKELANGSKFGPANTSYPIQVYSLTIEEVTGRGLKWVEKFQKLLSVKYGSFYRHFTNANFDYYVLLRENNVDLCTLTMVDTTLEKVTISIVLRDPSNDNFEEKQTALKEQILESIIADTAYFLWTESFWESGIKNFK